MSEKGYTILTFSPVQGFIEKSRKLLDLYGSSFILSYLAHILCKVANSRQEEDCVISPALIKVAQGTPNLIIIAGNFPEAQARAVFQETWRTILHSCREWVEDNLTQYNYSWSRQWQAWENHTWEFFWAKGETITEARAAMTNRKHSRDWVGVNWEGESSTLSGADGIAWYKMSSSLSPKERNLHDDTEKIKEFYKHLSRKIGAGYLRRRIPNFDRIAKERKDKLVERAGESIITEREQLSIPELIKRLITLEEIRETIDKKLTLDKEKESFVQNYPDLELSKEFSEAALSTDIEIPDKPFKQVNRHEEKFWTGWFQGDGDRMGQFLNKIAERGEEREKQELKEFSSAMVNWGRYELKPDIEERQRLGRIVYAGGDDFFGIFFPSRNQRQNLSAGDCLQWLQQFPQLWSHHSYSEDVTASVGFVWTAPGVPQRDVVQHCRLAEKVAKSKGRNRLAIRVLFNGGNSLEWVCPWHLLKIFWCYRDRDGNSVDPNWGHIYQDVATLEARGAFTNDNIEVAKALMSIYFGEQMQETFANRQNWWNNNSRSGKDSRLGILGEKNPCCTEPIIWLIIREFDVIAGTLFLRQTEKAKNALNNWVINLAKVGFHLLGNKATRNN